MTLRMPCTSCGFQASATSHQALVVAYLEHSDWVHPPIVRETAPSADALRQLVATMQGRRT